MESESGFPDHVLENLAREFVRHPQAKHRAPTAAEGMRLAAAKPQMLLAHTAAI
jgi:hypothetical protein